MRTAIAIGLLLVTTTAHAELESGAVLTGGVAGRIGRSGLYDDRFSTYGADLTLGGEFRSEDAGSFFLGLTAWGTLASTPRGRLVTAYGGDLSFLFRVQHLRFGAGFGAGGITIARSTGPSSDSAFLLRALALFGVDVLTFSNGGGLFIDLRGVYGGYLSSVDLSLGVRFR